MGKTVTALLFIIGAITSVVQAIPLLRAANAAAENIAGLEDRLEGGGGVSTPPAETGPAAQFAKIELRRVIFDYKDRFSDISFEVGPIDFVVRPGELILILGGNGSGKSTLLKLLVGLYQPNLGEIRLDAGHVTTATRDNYRALFTAIFSDYHLFKRLYGISSPDSDEINGLLARFELGGKTRVVDGEFSNLELSAGQRKRLAMVVALLERRPVLVLDEWTADQDPEFRKKFYHELLPELQRSGRTIIAVTHDERYIRELTFPARIIRMEEGRIVEDYMLPQPS